MKKLIICLLVLSKQFVAQQAKIDSLLQVVKTAKEDTTKVNALNNLSNKMLPSGNYQKSLQYANQAIDICSKSLVPNSRPVKKGLANAINQIGIVYLNQSNYQKALSEFNKSLSIKEAIVDKKGIASTLNNIGVIYLYTGDHYKALDKFVRSLAIRKEIQDNHGLASGHNNIALVYSALGDYGKALEEDYIALQIYDDIKDQNSNEYANTLMNIGVLYNDQGNHQKALDHYFKALKITESLGNKKSIGNLLNNIGNIYTKNGQAIKDVANDELLKKKKLEYNNMALQQYYRSLKVKEEIKDVDGIAGTYMNIGGVYSDQKDYKKASDQFLKALKIEEEIGQKQGISLCNQNLGALCMMTKEYSEARVYLDKALNLSKSIGSKDLIKETYKNLCMLDSVLGKWQSAYENHKLYVIYKDSMLSDENNKKTVRAQMNYDFSKKEQAAKLEQEKKDVVVNEEKQKQKIIIASVSIGLILVLILSFVILRSLRQNQRKNKIITEQKELVEEKQKEILDSIHYAKRIQTALITSEKYIEKNLNKLIK